MTTRTTAKNLIWETVSGGFTLSRARKELAMEKTFHPNHYVKMKKIRTGVWEIVIAKKPRRGKKRATAHGLFGASAEHDSKRDSFFVRGRKY